MSVDTKYGEAIFKQTQEVAEMFKAAMPKITTNKNGYEIRTKVLKQLSALLKPHQPGRSRNLEPNAYLYAIEWNSQPPTFLLLADRHQE